MTVLTQKQGLPSEIFFICDNGIILGKCLVKGIVHTRVCVCVCVCVLHICTYISSLHIISFKLIFSVILVFVPQYHKSFVPITFSGTVPK